MVNYGKGSIHMLIRHAILERIKGRTKIENMMWTFRNIGLKLLNRLNSVDDQIL